MRVRCTQKPRRTNARIIWRITSTLIAPSYPSRANACQRIRISRLSIRNRKSLANISRRRYLHKSLLSAHSHFRRLLKSRAKRSRHLVEESFLRKDRFKNSCRRSLNEYRCRFRRIKGWKIVGTPKLSARLFLRILTPGTRDWRSQSTCETVKTSKWKIRNRWRDSFKTESVIMSVTCHTSILKHPVSSTMWKRLRKRSL